MTTPLGEVAAVFLKLGATAFGGPAAHVAMMEEEVVRRRAWVDRQTYLDLLGATNLIPGPNSTEMAIHLGFNRAGWRGLIVAGVCFILPSMLIVMALAYLYQRFGSLPQANWLLYGVKPVIVAVVAQALYGLIRTAVKGWPTGLAAAGAALGAILGHNEIALLALAGALVMYWANRKATPGKAAAIVPVFLFAPAAAATATPAVAPTLLGLTLFFLKVGAVLYGSGYVLLAFIQSDLVNRWGWLTSQQLLDAVAVGQFTPGPVSTAATFIGYLLFGVPGALTATLAMFLPSFIFVWGLGVLLPVLRRSRWVAGFLQGVNAASLGLMVAVTLALGRAAVTDWLTSALAVAALALLLRYKINSAWLVLGGAVVGFLVH